MAMIRKSRAQTPDTWLEIKFPVKGLSRDTGFEHPPPLTAREAQNIRSYNPLDFRQRGGPREGLTKLFAAKVSGAHRVQYLGQVTGTSAAVSGSLDTRTIKGIAVADGDVFYWTVGTDSTWQAATTGTNALSTTAPVVFATEHSGRLFFADGTNAKLYTASTNAVTAWTAATAGTLPAVGGDLPRLICTWRGRVVVSGIRTDAHNWFMSAIDDPLDWDYAPAVVDESIAVAGDNSEAGKVGDVITGLIPASDDTLFFLGDHSVWRMTGDPMAGGRIDLISDQVGGAWGAAWCKDDAGHIYFMGTTGGIFKIQRGANQIERISLQVDELMTNVPGMVCRMIWDQIQQGFYVFRTSPAGLATINFFHDVRNNAWWPDVYAAPAHNPLAVHLLDGDNPNDRKLLLGGTDGYVRYIDATAPSDDGTAITAHVMLGPIMDGQLSAFLLKELHAIMDLDAFGYHGPVRWRLYIGNSAQRAVIQPVDQPIPPPAGTAQTEYREADATGLWNTGRNRVTTIRRDGTAFYLWLFSEDGKTWRLERLLAKIRNLGHVRQRWAKGV